MFGGGHGKNDRMDVIGPQRAISSGVKNGELVMSIGEKDCSKSDVFGWFFFGNLLTRREAIFSPIFPWILFWQIDNPPNLVAHRQDYRGYATISWIKGCNPTNPICAQLSKRGPDVCDFFDVLDSKVLSNPDIRKIATKCAQKKRYAAKQVFCLELPFCWRKPCFKKTCGIIGSVGTWSRNWNKVMLFFVVLWHVHPRIMCLQMVFNFNIQSFTICRISPKKSSHCFQLQFPGCFSRLKFKGPRNDKCLAESHFSSLQKPAQKAHPQNTLWKWTWNALMEIFLCKWCMIFKFQSFHFPRAKKSLSFCGFFSVEFRGFF